MKISFILTIVITACLTACSSSKNTTKPLAGAPAITNQTDQSITEKYWKLIELNGQKISAVATQPREAHMILKTQESQVKGHSGCNAFMGSYELGTGNSLHFTPFASTKMYCQEVPYESDFLKMFGSVNNFTLKGDTLILNDGSNTTLAKFVVVYLH